MVRSLSFVSAMLCAAAIVSAQSPAERPAGNPAAQAPAAQQPMPSSERQEPAVAKVTYSGCVKPGTTPGSFILDSANLTPAAGASSAQPSASAVGTSGAMKTTLNLTTKVGTDLAPHTNHKVEVTGTLAPAARIADSPAPPAGQAAAARPVQGFNVESVKMVSTTCP